MLSASLCAFNWACAALLIHPKIIATPVQYAFFLSSSFFFLQIIVIQRDLVNHFENKNQSIMHILFQLCIFQPIMRCDKFCKDR